MGAIVTVIFPLLYCSRSVKLAISDAFFFIRGLLAAFKKEKGTFVLVIVTCSTFQ